MFHGVRERWDTVDGLWGANEEVLSARLENPAAEFLRAEEADAPARAIAEGIDPEAIFLTYAAQSSDIT